MPNNLLKNDVMSKKNADTVVAVVVTYNRKDLLGECLGAIKQQSVAVKRIILVDNASTDGTHEYLQKKGLLDGNLVQYVLMKKNTGGSGGFFEGIRRARKCDADWVWLMDDDTIPNNDCLEKLLNGIVRLKQAGESNIAFAASSVYGENGEFMNVPEINHSPSENGYSGWYRTIKLRAIGITNASFVSVLINKDAILKCGLPCRDYFIWGDDTEYTTRLSRKYGPGFLIGDSEVVHKRKNAKTLNIKEESDVTRINMYYYYYRNAVINARLYGLVDFKKLVIRHILFAMKLITDEKGIQKSKIVIKGTVEGVLQYRRFERYISKQLS